MNHRYSIILLMSCLLAGISFARPIAIKLTNRTNKSSVLSHYKRASIACNDAFPNATPQSGLAQWITIDDRAISIDSLRMIGAVEIIDSLVPRQIDVIHSVPKFLPQPPPSSEDQAPDVEPYRYMQWHLDRICADAASVYTHGSESLIVAVVDIGTDIHHPDLEERLYINASERNGFEGMDDDQNGYIDDWSGWDFADHDNDPSPPSGSDEEHGTHIAGIILGAMNSRFGTGIAPHVKLLAVRVGSLTNVYYGYQGIYYAVQRGAKLINCSWSSDNYSPIEAAAVQYAISQGAVIIAAAGNLGVNHLTFPAILPGVISVGATDRNDLRASFSNYGSGITTWAPGLDIPSTLPNSSFGLMSGTSMAAPVVTGVAALVMSINPNLTPAEFQQIVVGSADQIHAIESIPASRVNAYRAVAEALALQGTTVPQWSGDPNPRGIIRLTIPIQQNNISDEIFSLDGTTISGGSWIGSTTTMTNLDSGRSKTGTLSLYLPVTIVRGHSITIGWRARVDQNTRFTGIATTRLAPPEVTIEDSQMRLTFSGIGALGVFDKYSPYPIGVSLQSPPGAYGVIYHGSFLLAVAPENTTNCVIDNVWGDGSTSNDWEVSLMQPITTTGSPPTRMETMAQPLFTRSTLPVQVYWTAQMASSDARTPAVDITARIHNSSPVQIEKLIAGWIIDLDVGDYSHDVASAQLDKKLITIGDTSASERYGIWINNGNVSVLRSINPPSPYSYTWTDKWKCQLLSSTGSTGTTIAPSDYALLFATDSFSLAGNADYLLSFRLFKATSLQQANYMVTEWNGGSMTGSQVQPKKSEIKISNFGSRLNVNLPQHTSATVTVFDVLGREVKKTRIQDGASNISLFGLPFGTYFIATRTANTEFPVHKIVYLP